MKRQDIFICKLPGDINRIRGIVNDAIHYLTQCCGSINECDLFELKVILNELILNAVKHGINEDMNKFVRVITGVRKDGRVFIMVEDEGDGCDYDSVIKRSFEEVTGDVCDVRENGRGIIIVKGLCDRIKFNRKGNKVVIIKSICRAEI